MSLSPHRIALKALSCLYFTSDRGQVALRPVLASWCKWSLQLIGDPGVLLQSVCRHCLTFSICQKCDSNRRRLCMSRMTKYRRWKVNEPEEATWSPSREASGGSADAAPFTKIAGGAACEVRRRVKEACISSGGGEGFTCYFHSEGWDHWRVHACIEAPSCRIHYGCWRHQLFIKGGALGRMKKTYTLTSLICFQPSLTLK